MTAIEILHKALSLLGYTDSDGAERLDTRIKSRAIPIINQVYADLFYLAYPEKEFIPIKDLSGKIDLPQRILDEVMPYGVASFIAQSESDGDQQQLYILLYNEKRKLLGRITEIKDGMGV